MNKAQKLHADYEEALKHLQETCLHEQSTDWIDEWWAPGHSTGRQVKCCLECGKVVSFKVNCGVCNKELVDDEMKEFTAEYTSPQTHFYGWPYCADCLAKPDPTLQRHG
jgi:hypothetical protein